MFFRRTLALQAAAAAPASLPVPTSGPRFGVDIDPGVLYGVQTIDEALAWLAGVRRVTRREAIAVPAVKRSRDLIAAGLGQLPLKVYDRNGHITDQFSPNIVEQPEEGIPTPVTWTNVVDDLFFHSRSWLAIKDLGWHGKPATVRRLDPETVSAQPRIKTVRTETATGSVTHWTDDQLLIRIDSPNDPILVAGARAIRAIGLLEAAALKAADGVPPVDWFETADSLADPFEDDDEVTTFLDDWAAARKARRTAYVPNGLAYKRDGWNPEELQLASARDMAITEIARLAGVDPEELGVSTTSRTYANSQDRRKAFLDFTLGPYMRAIESRLSMNDVTPVGYSVRFDTTDFLRADDKTTAETDEVLIRSGVLTVDEVRARRGLAPLPADQKQKQETPA